MGKLCIADRLIKAKTRLMGDTNNKGFPFFAYIIMKMDIQPDERIPTAAVNFRGEMRYNSTWMDSLTDNQLSGVLCHEALHVVFLHLLRCGRRQPEIWNIATDIQANYVLKQNNIELPEGGLIPQGDEITLFEEIKIVDISKKFAESVYDEVYHKLAKKGKIINVYINPGGKSGDQKDGKGSGNGKKYEVKTFDHHENGKFGDDAESQKEKDKIERHWNDVFVGAVTEAKQRGVCPAGMDRILDKILNKKMNWRTLLRKYVSQDMMSDYTWQRPSRRTYGTGIYMPGPLKENIDMVTTVDTSGSIGNEELGEFVGHMTKICRSFSNLRMTCLVGDAELQATYEFKNGDMEKIRSIKPKGGGGTSHEWVPAWIKKNKPRTKCCIMLTDGYSDLQEACKKFPRGCAKIIVLTTNSVEPKALDGCGKIIKIEEN